MQINMFPQQQNFGARKLPKFDATTLIGKYAQEVLELPRVSNRDEPTVVKAFRQGNPKARQSIIDTALRFVVYNVNNLVGLSHPLAMDLIQDGNAVLIGAINRAAIKQNGPKTIFGSLNSRINQAIAKALPEDIKVDTQEFLPVEDDILPVEIKASNRVLRKIRHASLNEELSFSMPTGKGKNLADVVTDDVTGNPLLSLEKSEVRRRLSEVMSDLSVRYTRFLESRFVKGLTLEEIGSEFNVGREGARQIEIKALKKLQHPVRARKLEGYVTREV